MELDLQNASKPVEEMVVMVVVSFNFTKISAERTKAAKAKIKINNNVLIRNVEEQKLALGASSQQTMKVSFQFLSNYEPGAGVVELMGDLVYLDEPKKIKAIVDKWKKSKQMEKDALSVIMNNILSRCNIQALITARDVGLPSPIPLPKVNVGGKTKNA